MIHRVRVDAVTQRDGEIEVLAEERLRVVTPADTDAYAFGFERFLSFGRRAS